MQVHRLHGVDPATLVKTLLEIGQLEPSTRLEVDAKNKSIIAYASLSDHLTIRQVVQRLDGSGRKFEVIQLRRLESDYVAGTIEFMMIGPPEPKQQQSRYYYYDPYSRGGNTETKDEDKFRVDADTENNRLLLWANEIEVEEVTSLLAKLGEIPARGGNPEKLRILDSMPAEELQLLLERLRGAWPTLAPNPLTLPKAPSNSNSQPSPQFDSIEPTKETRVPAPPKVILAALAADEPPQSTNKRESSPPAEPPVRSADQPSPGESADTPNKESADPRSRLPVLKDGEERQESAPAPVTISVAPDGRIVLFSQDTQALDMLEELIGQVSPPRRDYRIYKLKHADSFWVRKNLEDFFDESDEQNSRNTRNVYYYDYYNMPTDKEKPRSRLSKRKKLKLIDDLDTNSILVQGADAEQLRTIEDLIRIYDQPQQADSSAARLSSVIQVQYSKAQTIATAVKDVYRDLLSSNDKALASSNPEQKNRIPTGANTYIINEGGSGGDEDKERTRVTFKGKLSIGVDEVTNTLLVSAEGENLMRNVTEMIKSLDEAAKPLSSVSVMTVGNASNATKVREVLARLLIESKPAPKPNGQQPQQPQQPQLQQQPGVQSGGEGSVPAVAESPQ
jgi:hypothetical protein